MASSRIQLHPWDDSLGYVRNSLVVMWLTPGQVSLGALVYSKNTTSVKNNSLALTLVSLLLVQQQRFVHLAT